MIREQARSGRLDALGIKVVRLGAQARVVTASLWAFLGIDAAADGASSEARPRRPARPGEGDRIRCPVGERRWPGHLTRRGAAPATGRPTRTVYRAGSPTLPR